VTPVRIGLEFLVVAEHGASPLLISEKNAGKSPRQFGTYLPQVHHLPRTGGKLNLKAIAQVVVELLQRFNQQVVRREPDRPAPIGVSTEHAGRAFGGFIGDVMNRVVELQDVGMFKMKTRKRTDAKVGQELAFIQHYS